MAILVTGCAGFIGSHLCEALINSGHKVIGVDNLSTGKYERIHKSVDFIKVDLRSKSQIDRIPIGDISTIFHLAAQSGGDKSFDDPVFDLESNTITTLNLLEHFKNTKVHFIFASSMATYGQHEEIVNEETSQNPISFYGISKLSSELYLRAYSKVTDIKYTSLRIFNAYGPKQDIKNLHQGIVSIFLGQALINKRILVKGSGKRLRDFVYIDDVVQIMTKCIKNNKSYNTEFNVASGKSEKIEKLVNIIKHELPFSIEVEYKGNTRGDIDHITASIKKSQDLLKYLPTTGIEVGVKEMVKEAIEN